MAISPTRPANPTMSVTVVDTSVSYETVAAGQTNQVLGATGAKGDFLVGIIVQPATTTPGAVTLKDDTTAILSIPSGTFTLQPYYVPLGIPSRNGAWNVTTGTNVSVIGVGTFA